MATVTISDSTLTLTGLPAEPEWLYSTTPRPVACRVTGIGDPQDVVEQTEGGEPVVTRSFGEYQAVATYETPEDAAAVAAFLLSAPSPGEV